MSKKRIIVIGGGGHAKVVLDILREQNLYEVIGVVSRDIPEFSDYPYLGTDENLDTITKEQNIFGGVIAIGDNSVRKLIAERIKTNFPNFKFINAIHPKTIISKDATFGEGCVVMAGVIMNPDCEIGNHTILNTGCIFDHDGKLEDYASIAPGAVLGGNVHIGTLSAVSLAAKIIHSIKIGKNTIIGAGSVVVKDIEDNVVAVGVPAKVIKNRKIGDKYL